MKVCTMLNNQERKICRSLGLSEDGFTAHKLHKKMAQAARPVTAQGARIARMARALSVDPRDLAVAYADRSFDDTVSAHGARALVNAPTRVGKEVERMGELNEFDPDADPKTHAANSRKALKAYSADPMGDSAMENLSRAAAFALLALEALLAPTGEYQQANSPALEPARPAAE